jgi:hypothetical protein
MGDFGFRVKYPHDGDRARLRPFTDLYVDCDPLDPGWVGDLYSRLDTQFSDDGIRRFFPLDTETGYCPTAQDVMPCATTCALLVSSRIVGSAPTIGNTRASSSSSDIAADFSVTPDADPSSKMFDDMGRIAGKDDSSVAQLGSRVGNRGDLFLMRDEHNRSTIVFKSADHIDNVADREHVDADGGLVKDRQPRFHAQHRGQLDAMAFPAAKGFIDPPIQVTVRV